AGSARPQARGPGRATTDCRTPVREPQSVDGRHPLPDPHPRQGPNRDEPPRPGVKPQANDHDLRRGTADGGDQNLIASLKPHEPVGRPTPPPSAPRNASPSSTSYDAFFHSLGRIERFPPPGLSAQCRLS